MAAPRATEKQVRYIRHLQHRNGFPLSPVHVLQRMTSATASGWIASLEHAVNPKTSSPKKSLGAKSSNSYVRADQVRHALKTGQV